MGKSDEFLAVLKARGAFHQCTDDEGLAAAFARGPVSGYIGFDATAPSLHVGSLLQIMTLRRLQQAGGRPIVVMGGGTTKIGDPSGKDASRRLLSDADIAANIASIRTVFERFLRFGDGPTDAIMVDNAEWLDGLAYVPFLREYGTHFTINRMLTFDSVRLRLEREQPLTFLEFNYMILQAYDFVELHRRHGCVLQMGGSDQWGNIVNGIELGRRAADASLFGVTSPLVTTASGAKMGKTADGAVWLNADQLSPWDYWQYWRNTEDADVGRFLRLFTELPEAEITRLGALQGAEINEAKKVLASEATAMLHGRAEAQKAAETARQTFEAGTLARDLPALDVPRAELAAGVLVAALATRAGLTASNGEARRMIEGGGVRLDDAAVPDPAAVLKLDAFSGEVVKLSVGRKKHVLIRPV